MCIICRCVHYFFYLYYLLMHAVMYSKPNPKTDHEYRQFLTMDWLNGLFINQSGYSLQCRQDGTITYDAIVPSIVFCSYLCYFVYVIQFPV